MVIEFSQGFAALGRMGWWGSRSGGSARGQSQARLVFGWMIDGLSQPGCSLEG